MVQASVYADRLASVMTTACRWQLTAGPHVGGLGQLYMKYTDYLNPHGICYLQTMQHNIAHSVK